MGVVALYPGETIKAHFNDWGIKCMFLVLGYAAHHAGNVYQKRDLRTMRVLFTRDVKWLGRSFQDNKKTNQTMYQEDIGEDLITPLPTNKAPEDMQAIHEDENQEVEEPVGQPRLSSQPFPDQTTIPLNFTLVAGHPAKPLIGASVLAIWLNKKVKERPGSLK